MRDLYPLAHERTFHGESPVSVVQQHIDPVERVLHAMQRAYAVDMVDEREALLRGLERLREELSPAVRCPRRSSGRVSRKAKRRACSALDQFIEAGRSRAF